VNEPTTATGGLRVGRGGALLEQAAAHLARGPASTAELAREVLGMQGPEGVAAQAVWTLLADDPRFAVDVGGTWTLCRAAMPPTCRLQDEEWVVVDVETTGGSPAAGHRITEIAAVRVAGGEIRDVYSTLVNPGRRIPRMITALTGITDEMVADAPRFRDVAPRLADALRGGVFVAHNAAFDWRFVRAELALAGGMQIDGRQLCTVRLARKLLPQLPSRSLDGVAAYFGLEIAARHRAEDDAVATAHVLLRLLDMLADRGIEDWPGIDRLLAGRAPRRKRRASPRSMDSA
jgi:DNA polymerase-3 subunit epsilon